MCAHYFSIIVNSDKNKNMRIHIKISIFSNFYFKKSFVCKNFLQYITIWLKHFAFRFFWNFVNFRLLKLRVFFFLSKISITINVETKAGQTTLGWHFNIVTTSIANVVNIENIKIENMKFGKKENAKRLAFLVYY